jgi:hypothetical protein
MEWREVCRCLSGVTTLSAHIVLQEFECILVSRAFKDLFLYMFPYHNLEF